jgi:hypothetical protein
MKPLIRKLGTIDLDIVETTPVVFRGILYRFEYIRTRYKSNQTGDSYFRFVTVETGNFSPPFGHGYHLGSALVHQDKVYVFAVKSWGGDAIFMLESENLCDWSEPRMILHDPRWAAYNTSACRGQDRFIMAYELGKPEEEVGVPFTIFFAESDDLNNWRKCAGVAPFTPDRYSACPTIRFCNDYYYMIYLEGSYKKGFRQHLVRSADLRQWQQSPFNPFLDFSTEDYLCNAEFSEVETGIISKAKNINNSDADLCEYKNHIVIYYSWGDQKGVEFLAEAVAPGQLNHFLASWFPEAD